MKVAIDISPLKTGHQFRGIGVYTKNIVDSFKKANFSQLKLQLVEQGQISNDTDLIHYPYFDLFFLTLPIKKLKPTIVTIHDVVPLIFPDYYPAGIKGTIKFQIQKFSLRNVKAIITDSENSKKDIFKYLNFPREKIYVVPLAPSENFKVMENQSILSEVRKKYHLPEKFVLYVGDVNYNKNISGLIRAFVQIEHRTENIEHRLKLVLVGKAFLEENLKETQEILQLIKSLKLSKKEVIRLGWIPQEDLVGIYNLATVYCQQSFYEGFGLPVLEAMACGCPVAAAKTSSLPEICGQAAVIFNPHDTESIVGAIKKAIEKKTELIELGLKQVKKFTWVKTAQKTYEVYQKMV